MEKNIIVVDEQGNQLDATYPKRAKGLVKHGRARFVDEHTICLACPPNDLNLEDRNMSENINTKETLSVDYILAQIEKIVEQTAHIHEAIAQIGEMDYGAPECGAPPDDRAHALGDIVRCRETTNQQLLAFYRELYEDLKPTPTMEERKFALLERMAKNPSMLGSADNISLVLAQLAQL